MIRNLLRGSIVALDTKSGAILWKTFDMPDNGGRDTISGSMFGHTWLPIEYSQGLVRVGVQSALAHSETEALIQKLMEQRGIPVPPPIKSSVCLAIICSGSDP